MKNVNHSIGYLVSILLIIAIIIAFFFFGRNDKKATNSSYDTQKTATQNEGNSFNANKQNTIAHKPVETELSTFSTNIYTKESGRQNNMELTASRLNNHIVKNGEIFSFCEFSATSFKFTVIL